MLQSFLRITTVLQQCFIRNLQFTASIIPFKRPGVGSRRRESRKNPGKIKEKPRKNQGKTSTTPAKPYAVPQAFEVLSRAAGDSVSIDNKRLPLRQPLFYLSRMLIRIVHHFFGGSSIPCLLRNNAKRYNKQRRIDRRRNGTISGEGR